MTDGRIEEKAVQEICIQNAIRDGRLVTFNFRKLAEDLVVALVFQQEQKTVELELCGVTEFDFKYDEADFPLTISFVKALVMDGGGLYVSLDPWKEDERFASESDNDVFHSKSFSLK